VSLLFGFENSSIGSTSVFDESSATRAVTGGTGTVQATAGAYTPQGYDAASPATITGGPAAAGCDFGTGDFTVEGWLRLASLGSFNCAIGNFDFNDDKGSWGLFGTNTNKFSLLIDQETNAGPGSTEYEANKWYHVAVSRNDDTIRIFVNGKLDGKFTGYSGINIGGNTNIRLGGNNTGSADNFNGDIDELRVTKGTGRYSTDDSFIPPTQYSRG